MLGVHSTYPKPGKVIDIYVDNEYYGKLLEIRYDVKIYYKQEYPDFLKLPDSLIPDNINELRIRLDDDLNPYISQPAHLRPINDRIKIGYITAEDEGIVKRLGIPKLRDNYIPMFDDFLVN